MYNTITENASLEELKKAFGELNKKMEELESEEPEDENSHAYEECALFEIVGGTIMSSTGNLILGIIWILVSSLWFWAENNTAMGIIWLCAGIIELIIALIRRNKEKKRE